MDRLWVDVNHPEPSLLHRVDPAKGLVDTDFSTLADWLRFRHTQMSPALEVRSEPGSAAVGDGCGGLRGTLVDAPVRRR